MILISLFADLFRIIINIIIGILWHDVILFRFILYYKFVIFWHDIILLHICKCVISQHKERTKKQSIKTRIPLPLMYLFYR